MIPNKNLFCGSLGRTMKPGGSPFMTTPHTRVLAEPSYTIDLPVSGEFVCCTLNGRLWVYKTGKEQYSLVALKWDETKAELEYAASSTLSSAPIARGIDWLLLPDSIIRAIDEPPYILTSELFDRNGSNLFYYSLLRSQILAEVPSGMSVTLGPCIDPFTRKAWGMDPSNGNSDGWGCFSTNLGGAGLYPKDKRVMEACYSTLPSVGEWNIVEDFLIRRPEKATEDDGGGESEEEAEPTVEVNPYHTFMKEVRPLIPLEFNWYADETAYPAYGTGYSAQRRGIQVAACNNQLWGRGLTHLGQAFILPASFDESGQPQEFYLYIGASGGKGPYNQAVNPNLNEADPWLSVGVAALRDVSASEASQEDKTQ